jgi:asparagine synthase (glutamine-hydrolysing)
MANGLEVRVPLLDKSVLESAQILKPRTLNSTTDLKWILKRILSEYLPEKVIEKQKRGFTPPLKIWSRSILKNHISETLDSFNTLNLPFEGALSLFDYGKDYVNGKHDNLEGMWTLYSLIKWRECNL